MGKKKVIAIFDIGKTNKKILLFDEALNLVYSEMLQLPETRDEDGFPCENIDALTEWVSKTFERILSLEEYQIIAVNFSAYGASFVYLDGNGKTILPLYNYLKPYPESLKNKFYSDYGGELWFAKQTASPILGSLNSGMQVYRLKQERRAIFDKIKYVLHLPQYIAYIIGKQVGTDITSIGCHTNLWDFDKNAYHQWVYEEGVLDKLPPTLSYSDKTFIGENKIPVGFGLHDSSAALVPYLSFFKEPFALLSTGTWCISLNPFNDSALTEYELRHDCLSYLTYEGKPVKASRLFAGMWHEQETKRLSDYFHKPVDYFENIVFNSELIATNFLERKEGLEVDISKTKFAERNLGAFKNYEQAYHQLIMDLMELQVFSTHLILKNGNVKNIYVDGGFSKNQIYMNVLAKAFPDIKVYAASVPQASALGAALAIYPSLTEQPSPPDIIALRFYSK